MPLLRPGARLPGSFPAGSPTPEAQHGLPLAAHLRLVLFCAGVIPQQVGLEAEAKVNKLLIISPDLFQLRALKRW